MPEWLGQVLSWIEAHPGLAGVVIAAVAFAEGLAFVGILIPGIILLFGFGTLVGLEVLSLQQVWLWCSVGAIAGDGVSFWLGWHFKQHLREIWPFSRYAALLHKGEVFFRRHGTKSVVIGRFVGPVRPVMPVVAGMMDMPLRRYIPANIIAGILWAPAYLLPGVVFGASIELAQAVALRLALLLGLLVALGWALGFVVHQVYRFAAPRTAVWLAATLKWGRRHPVAGRFMNTLVDPSKPDSGTLIGFAAFLVLAAWLLVTLTIAGPMTDGVLGFDAAVQAWFETLRSPWADPMMSVLGLLGSGWVLLAGVLALSAWLAWRRRWLALTHYLGAAAFAWVLALLLALLFSLSGGVGGEKLPLVHVAVSVVVYGFFAVVTARELPRRSRVWPYVVAALLSAAVAVSRLYFGADQLSETLAGASFAILWITVVGIAYRRRIRRSFWMTPAAIIFLTAVGLTAVGMAAGGAADLHVRYARQPDVLSLSYAQWQSGSWAAERSLDFEFLGELDALQAAVAGEAWAIAPASRWSTALEMLQPSPDPESLPLLPSDLEGSPEALTLHHWDRVRPERQTVMRIWPTRVVVGGRPLWAGRVDEYALASAAWFFSYWQWAGRGPGSEDLAPLFEGLEISRTSSGVLRVRQSD